jgi:hypothetical protein
MWTPNEVSNGDMIVTQRRDGGIQGFKLFDVEYAGDPADLVMAKGIVYQGEEMGIGRVPELPTDRKRLLTFTPAF